MCGLLVSDGTVFINPARYIHSFSKRLTFQKYIYLLFLWAKQKKIQKVYIFIYISEMSTFLKTSVKRTV